VDRRQRAIFSAYPIGVPLQVADLVLQPLHLGFQPALTVGPVVAARLAQEQGTPRS
jgi:hypothetical protein